MRTFYNRLYDNEESILITVYNVKYVLYRYFLKLRSVKWIILYAKSSYMLLSNVLYTLFHLCDTVKRSVFGSGEALY